MATKQETIDFCRECAEASATKVETPPEGAASIIEIAAALGRTTTEVAELLEQCEAEGTVKKETVAIEVNGTVQKVVHFTKVDAVKTEVKTEAKR